MTTLTTHTLLPHPSGSGLSGEVLVSMRASPNSLSLTYRLPLDELVVPVPEVPRRCDGLWQHTCVEFFVADVQGTAYREFNFSPAGHWAAYDFTAYRVRSDDLPAIITPRILARRDDTMLQIGVELALSSLPDFTHACLGLTAVLETVAGTLDYRALRHPAGKPDFHHRDGFLLHQTFRN